MKNQEMTHSPTPIPEQGTDPLTLRARFDLQLNLRYLAKKSVDGPYEIYGLHTSNDQLAELTPIYQGRIKQILSDYWQINEWLREEEAVIDGQTRKVKVLVQNLLNPNDKLTIDKLWLIVQDTELADGYGDGWLSKSMIDKVNEKLKEDIHTYIDCAGDNNPNKQLGLFLKHLDSELTKLNINLELNPNGETKGAIEDAINKIHAFREFRRDILSIGHQKNPKTLAEVVANINEKYNLSLQVDNKVGKITNLDAVFWKKELAIPFMVETDYKQILAFKLGLPSNLTSEEIKEYERYDEGQASKSTKKRDKGTFRQELINWRHHQDHEPFIVRPLELKYWNYQLLLSGYFYDEKVLMNSDVHWEQAKTLGGHNKAIKNLMEVTEVKNALPNVKALAKEFKDTLERLRELKIRIWERDYPAFLGFDEYPQVSDVDKENLFIESLEDVFTKVLHKLGSGTFGLFKSSAAENRINVTHTLKNDILGLLDVTFKKKVQKIEKNPAVPKSGDNEKIKYFSVINSDSTSDKIRKKYLELTENRSWATLSNDDKCFIFGYDNLFNGHTEKRMFGERSPILMKDKHGVLIELSANDFRSRLLRGRAMVYAWYISEEKWLISEDKKVHLLVENLPIYKDILQKEKRKALKKGMKISYIKLMELAIDFLESGHFRDNTFWHDRILMEGKEWNAKELSNIKFETMLGLGYLESFKKKDSDDENEFFKL